MPAKPVLLRKRGSPGPETSGARPMKPALSRILLLCTLLFAACSSAEVGSGGSGGGGDGGSSGSGGTGGSGGSGGAGGSGGTGGTGGQTACTVAPQANCPTTQSCDYMANGTTYCRTATPGGDASKHCTLAINCDVGYGCFTVTGTETECLHYCATQADC